MLICDLPLLHPKNLFSEEASNQFLKKEPNFTTVKNPLEGEETAIYFSRRKTMQWENALLKIKKKRWIKTEKEMSLMEKKIMLRGDKEPVTTFQFSS